MTRRILITSISIILGFVLMFGVTLVQAHNGPFIIMDSKGRVNDCTTDPTPCFGRDITIENPLFKFVLVQLDCGPKMFDSPVVEISPRVRLTVQVTSNQPGSMHEGQCKIKFWKAKGL